MEEHEAIVKNRSAALRAALSATVPVMTGYLCLGAAFGILLRTAGYGIGWSIAMSMICYCGSMQFVGVSLLTAAFDPFQALLMSVMVNARHAFYGLSMLEKYRGGGTSTSGSHCWTTFTGRWAVRWGTLWAGCLLSTPPAWILR